MTSFFRARFTSFHAHASLLIFFSFSVLFHFWCSHAQVFGKTLVHDFLISYSHTEWYFIFSDSATTSAQKRIRCEMVSPSTSNPIQTKLYIHLHILYNAQVTIGNFLRQYLWFVSNFRKWKNLISINLGTSEYMNRFVHKLAPANITKYWANSTIVAATSRMRVRTLCAVSYCCQQDAFWDSVCRVLFMLRLPAGFVLWLCVPCPCSSWQGCLQDAC